MSRNVPERTEAQERTERRRAALKSMDVAQLRAWLETDGFGAFGDDAVVLQAAHESRAMDAGMSPALRTASRRWLREHHPDSIALQSDRQIVAGMRRR